VPPSARFDRLLHLLIELDRDDLDVLARSESMDQPGKPGAGADLQNPGHRSVPLRPVPRGREAEPVPGGGGDVSVCSPRSGPGDGG
jgi:hypothetical protein